MIALWKNRRRCAILAALVLLSVAACSDDGAEGAASGALTAPQQVADAKGGDGANTETADHARSVRIGAARSDFGRCEPIGRVGNLPGGDDNFLAVRAGPSSKAQELARLRDGARIYLCDRNENGRWLGVVYRSNGQLPKGDSCNLRESGGALAAVGECRLGWVSARYVMTERHVDEGGQPLATRALPVRETEANSGERPDAAETVAYIGDQCIGQLFYDWDDEIKDQWRDRIAKKIEYDSDRRYISIMQTDIRSDDIDDPNYFGIIKFDARKAFFNIVEGDDVSSMKLAHAKYVKISCISGDCMAWSRTDGDSGKTYEGRQGSNTLACKNPERVVRALEHLQSLAGGGMQHDPFAD